MQPKWGSLLGFDNEKNVRGNGKKKSHDRILTLFLIIYLLVMFDKIKKIICDLKPKYEVNKVSKILAIQLMVDAIIICLYTLKAIC